MDETSGSIDGHPSHGLGLDHFNLNKYSGPDDAYYWRVRDEIVEIVDSISVENAPIEPKNTTEGSGQ